MKQKMTVDELCYAMHKLGLFYKGDRGRFIRSQGWRVGDYDRAFTRRLMAGEFHRDIYKPVIRPEIKAKYEELSLANQIKGKA